MRATLPLRTTFVLAGLPVMLLLGLAMLNRLEWESAAVALLVVAVWAFILARIWVRDLRFIIMALHHAADDGPAGPSGQPSLAATAHIVREAERLARILATRTAEVEGLIRAERAIVSRLPDPLIVLSADRRVTRANAAAQAIFGAEMAAVARHPGLRAAIDRAQGQNQEQRAELSLPVPVAREVLATVLPLDPPLADGGRIVAVLSDRTRERAVERMRADFVANASHELRTPLASLIGFIDTLRGPAADDPPAQARFLGIMAEQAQRMNRLIDDLLSLSRIELTEHQPPADPVPIGPLLESMAAGFEPQAASRRIRLAVTADPGLPPVVGDRDQLDQVIHNLVDNALKYGREDGEVRVTAVRAAPGGRWPPRPGVLIQVHDDGQGIARAHIPRLTERFYRADKGRSRAVGGTGLGLAIVKHIVNRHRGRMGIDSTEGIGTTVTLWLPTEPGGGAARASTPSPAAPPGS